MNKIKYFFCVLFIFASSNLIFSMQEKSKAVDINLFVAAANGKSKAVLQAIQSGADVNYANPLGQTPLMAAANYGDETTVKYLLSRPGINYNAKDINGLTALMKAANQGHDEIVKMLLAKRNIDIDAKSSINSETAIEMAVKKGYEKVVRLLASAGANLTNVRNIDLNKIPAIDVAIVKKMQKIAEENKPKR